MVSREIIKGAEKQLRQEEVIKILSGVQAISEGGGSVGTLSYQQMQEVVRTSLSCFSCEQLIGTAHTLAEVSIKGMEAEEQGDLSFALLQSEIRRRLAVRDL